MSANNLRIYTQGLLRPILSLSPKKNGPVIITSHHVSEREF